MSLKESSYLSQMYNSQAPSEKVNQEPTHHLLQEINRDLNDNFKAQEQQQQEYSRIIANDKEPSLSFFYSDEQTKSQQPEIMTTNMTFRHRLERFYLQYCPDKNNQLGIIIEKYKFP